MSKITIRGPYRVIVSPKGGASRAYGDLPVSPPPVDRIVVDGGSSWVPPWDKKSISFERPTRVEVWPRGAAKPDVFEGDAADFVQVMGGSRWWFTGAVRRALTLGEDGGGLCLLGADGPDLELMAVQGVAAKHGFRGDNVDGLWTPSVATTMAEFRAWASTQDLSEDDRKWIPVLDKLRGKYAAAPPAKPKSAPAKPKSAPAKSTSASEYTHLYERPEEVGPPAPGARPTVPGASGAGPATPGRPAPPWALPVGLAALGAVAGGGLALVLWRLSAVAGFLGAGVGATAGVLAGALVKKKEAAA